jgi:anti-sigma factor RsiW
MDETRTPRTAVGDACDHEWLVGPFLDGELPDRERFGVESHLEGCAPCRTLVEQFRKLDSLARTVAPPPRVSAAEWGELWEGIRLRAVSNAASRRGGRRLRDWLVPLLSAAALLLAGVWIALELRPPVDVPPDVAAKEKEKEIEIQEASGEDARPEIRDGVIIYHDGRDG